MKNQELNFMKHNIVLHMYEKSPRAPLGPPTPR